MVPSYAICETGGMIAYAKKIAHSPSSDISARVDAIDWSQVETDLDAQGCAGLKQLLTPDECRALAALYPDDAHFRSRVVMARHGFGRGEYKYFAYPLPPLIAAAAAGALSRGSPRSPTAGTRRWESASLSGRARGFPEALPRCRPDAADAAAAAI